MTDKVLFVDDEPSVLEGIRRTMGRRLQVATAIGKIVFNVINWLSSVKQLVPSKTSTAVSATPPRSP